MAEDTGRPVIRQAFLELMAVYVWTWSNRYYDFSPTLGACRDVLQDAMREDLRRLVQ